jgi:pyruvate dehydrogenase E1 component
VWSVTSWGELRRDGVATERHNLLHPDAEPREPYVRRVLAGDGPVVAVSDWMRAVPDQIAPFVRRPWTSLGTDGFGHSDTRAALRRHFGIDAQSIVVRTLQQLSDCGELDESVPRSARTAYLAGQEQVGATSGGDDTPQ